jgi:hypothetical protein
MGMCGQDCFAKIIIALTYEFSIKGQESGDFNGTLTSKMCFVQEEFDLYHGNTKFSHRKDSFEQKLMKEVRRATYKFS